MFTMRRAVTPLLRRNFASGSWPKSVEAFPTKGLSHGGHPNVMQSEGKLAKVWFSDPGAYPILIITCGALLFAGYKVFVVDCNSPNVHFSKSERSTIDYIENDRDPEIAVRWTKSMLNHG